VLIPGDGGTVTVYVAEDTELGVPAETAIACRVAVALRVTGEL